jgi:hypothetical protein
MIPALLLALTLTVPLGNNDVHAVSVTNGDSTLVAWTNEFSVYPTAFTVYIRLLDSPFDRNAIALSNGYAPRVATNGRDYLVGWSIAGSRFNNSYPINNVAAQVVKADGTLGTRKILNNSVTGGVGASAWNGMHWLLGYRRLEGAYVALLDDALNVTATVDLGRGSVRALEEIGGRWWAIRVDETATEAIEIRDDGTIGARFATDPIPATLQITRGPLPLLLRNDEHGIHAIPFDPDGGFGSSRLFLPSTQLFDVEAFDGGGSLLLVSRPDDTYYEAVFVDASGQIGSSTPLYDAGGVYGKYGSLGASKNGPLLLVSPFVENVWEGSGLDLYAFRVTTLVPVDPRDGRLVSQINARQERRRAARH